MNRTEIIMGPPSYVPPFQNAVTPEAPAENFKSCGNDSSETTQKIFKLYDAVKPGLLYFNETISKKAFDIAYKVDDKAEFNAFCLLKFFKSDKFKNSNDESLKRSIKVLINIKKQFSFLVEPEKNIPLIIQLFYEVIRQEKLKEFDAVGLLSCKHKVQWCSLFKQLKEQITSIGLNKQNAELKKLLEDVSLICTQIEGKIAYESEQLERKTAYESAQFMDLLKKLLSQKSADANQIAQINEYYKRNSKFIDLNYQDQNGDSFLHIAIKAPEPIKKQLCLFFLEKGTKITFNKKGYSPLHMMVNLSISSDAFKKLISLFEQFRADFITSECKEVSNAPMPPLHLAAYSGNCDFFTTFLEIKEEEEKGEAINQILLQKDSKSRTPILYAVYGGDPNREEGERKGQIESLKWIEKKCGVALFNTQQGQGDIPLFFALKSPHESDKQKEIIRYLLEKTLWHLLNDQNKGILYYLALSVNSFSLHKGFVNWISKNNQTPMDVAEKFIFKQCKEVCSASDEKINLFICSLKKAIKECRSVQNASFLERDQQRFSAEIFFTRLDGLVSGLKLKKDEELKLKKLVPSFYVRLSLLIKENAQCYADLKEVIDQRRKGLKNAFQKLALKTEKTKKFFSFQFFVDGVRETIKSIEMLDEMLSFCREKGDCYFVYLMKKPYKLEGKITDNWEQFITHVSQPLVLEAIEKKVSIDTYIESLNPNLLLTWEELHFYKPPVNVL